MKRPGPVARAALVVGRHPKAAWIVALIAFCLSLPLLGAGYFLDDGMHTYVLEGNDIPGGPRGTWDLYRFADGGEGTRQATREGFFPWWTTPDLKLAFFRPIPSLWRAADHALWGESAFVPHLEASIVFALLVFVVARTYGRLIGGVAAGVAALLFAVDDAHGLLVGWIANRYALLVALFGIASLCLLLPKAEENEAPARIRFKTSLVSAGLFGLAMLSGEAALGAFAYLLAYAWFAHPGGKKAGLASIAPHFAVLAMWALVYRGLGYGAHGSAFYVDPLRSPIGFAGAALERLPRLALAQLFGPPSEMWTVLPASGRIVYGAITIGLSALFIAVLIRATRHHPAAKVLGWGALLAAVPTCATTPGDRLLILPGFGAFGLLAIAFVQVWTKVDASRALRATFAVLGAVHFVIAPIMMALAAWNFVWTFGGFVERGHLSLPNDEALREQDLVVVSTPDVLMTNYMLLERLLGRGVSSRTASILTVQDRGTATIERTDDRTYVIRNDAGQNGGPFQHLYREGPMVRGETFQTEVMDVRVVEVSATGAPTVIEFRFRKPLEAYRWVVWRGAGFVEIPTVGQGERVEVAGTPFFEALE